MEQKNSRQIKFKRLKNQVKAVVTNPYNVIVLVAIVLLTYLIVLPLVDMLSTTFQLAQRDLRATGGTMADVGKFTLYYWQRLLASDLSWNLLFKPLLNSLTIGVGVSVCAIALGSILAWLMVRSDLPFKPFFSLAVIIPYMIPSWVKSQAWLSMFKTPRVGGAPGFIAALMMNAGVSTERIEAILSPIAYGRLAIIIVLTLHYYKKEFFPYITYLKTDAAEAEILTGTSDRREAARLMVEWGVKEALITHNTEVLVYDGKDYYTCPLKPRGLDGRTGRGDTTFSAYITERERASIPQALEYASALVSLKMETPGPFKGKREDVETFIHQYYR